MRQQENKQHTALFLAFLWPFAGLYSALTKWRQPWAKNAFWMVCVYMGFIHIFSTDGNLSIFGVDSQRYVMELQDMFSYRMSLREVFFANTVFRSAMDVYQPLATWLVSRFTDNGHVLFGLFALVFGFFYSRNVWCILERLPEKTGKALLLMVASLFLVCPIWDINGVRMWTAAHVFLYGLLPYLLNGDRKKSWWMAASVLFHFSYLYIAVFGLLYVFLPERTKTGKAALIVAMALFIFSLTVETLNNARVASTLERFSPDEYDDRIELYTTDLAMENMQTKGEDANWYVRLAPESRNWVCNILLLLLYPLMRRRMGGNERLFYVFVLAFGAVANIMSLLPSGGRFQTIAVFLKLGMLLVAFKEVAGRTVLPQLYKLGSLVLVLSIVFSLRTAFDFYGLNLFFGDFFTVPFVDVNMPLINFVRKVI